MVRRLDRKRYMHVPREVVTAIAAEVGSFMWAETGTGEEEDGSAGAALTGNDPY